MTAVLNTCSACQNVQHGWQDRYCVACWSTDLAEASIGGEATLLTWATYHVNYRLDGFAPPYSVGLVQLDEGPRMPCLLVGDVSQARYKQRLRVRAGTEVSATEAGIKTPDLTAIVVAHHA